MTTDAGRHVTIPLAARTDTWVAVVSESRHPDSGYHQNSGAGSISGPINLIFQLGRMDVSGQAKALLFALV